VLVECLNLAAHKGLASVAQTLLAVAHALVAPARRGGAGGLQTLSHSALGIVCASRRPTCLHFAAVKGHVEVLAVCVRVCVRVRVRVRVRVSVRVRVRVRVRVCVCSKAQH
jgi:hypothetical protein